MAAKYFGTMMVNVYGVELLIVDLKKLTTLESVKKKINLGDFVYNQEPIDFNDVTKIFESITGFVQILQDYQINDFELWGSHAISQAVNADFIADQLFMHTGQNIHWLSTSEETYYRNQQALAEIKKGNGNPAGATYLIGVNSGATTISKFANQKFVTSAEFALGPIKIAEDLEDIRQGALNSTFLLNDYIDSKLSDYYRELSDGGKKKSSQVFLVGTLPFQQLMNSQNEKNKNNTLSIEQFDKIWTELRGVSDQYLMEKYQIEESYVPLFLPEMILIKRLLEITHASAVTISEAGVLDGLMIERAGQRGYLKADFTEQTVTTAINMANRYGVDPNHRRIVTKFALHMFDQLKGQHHLGKRDRMLLQVAVILHDVGNYINPHHHYLHSDYIIRHSEIIGLSDDERNIIAAIARYHSVRTPSDDLSHFKQQTPENRRLIAKLAAILRLADALDDDRQQRIKKIAVSVRAENVIITASSNENLTFVSWVFKSKSQFFTETYGLRPVFKQRSVSKG